MGDVLFKEVRGSGGGGCFRAGTQVQLEGGKTASIETLKEGDSVLAFDEVGSVHLAKVTKVHYHADPQPILHVKFWRGEAFLTPNHWVLNQYSSFVEMGTLSEHDALVDGMGHLRPVISADLIGHEPVWNLTVEPHHTFIANGIRVHNGGHRDRFPVVEGSGGGGSSKGSGGRAAVEADDTLQSKASVGIIDLLGEGEIGGLVNGSQSIYINGTPLMNADGTYNFTDVVWQERKGTQDQVPLSGSTAFDAISSPVAVGTRLKFGQPHSVSIQNPQANQATVIVNVPSLMEQNKKSGDINGTKVEYKIELSVDGGPFQSVGYSNLYAGTASIAVDKTTKSITIEKAAKTTADGMTFVLTATAGKEKFGDISFKVQYWNAVTSAWDDTDTVRTLSAGYVTTTGAYTNGTPAPYETASSFTFGYTKMRVVILSKTDTTMVLTASNARPYTLSSTLIIDGKTRSRYQRAHTFDVPAGGLRVVRVSRITADSTSSALANELYFDSFVERVTTKLSYPNSALIGVSVNAAQFSSIPSRSYLVDGLYIRVPTNYDPVAKIYNGVWNGTFKLAISSNPAWILYDLITSKRYGLGDYVRPEQVDKATLYKIGRYCDELVPNGIGGFEPRFVANIVINTLSDAYKLIGQLSSIFRGMGFWNGSGVDFTNDAPRDPVMIYNQTNVIDGNFVYTGSARKNRHSVAMITWNDPEETYKQKIEYVEDAELIEKFGIRKIDMVAFGCTSRSQAHRLGRWILYTEKYESQLITFKVGIDSAMVMPGEIVMIHDDHRSGKRLGGRAAASTLTSLTLDAPVTLTAGTGTLILVRMPDGTFAERPVLEGVGEHSVVTWVEALAELPVAGAIYIVSEPNLKPMMARVVGVAQGDKPGTFALSVLEHNPGKYELIENGYILEQSQVELINRNAVTLPSNLVVESIKYIHSVGETRVKLLVSWTCDMPGYELSWRKTKSTTDWTVISTSLSSAEIDNIEEGGYQFSLIAKNIFGVASQSVDTEYTYSNSASTGAAVTGVVIDFTGRDCNIMWRLNSRNGSYEFGSEDAGADAGALDADFKDWEVRVANVETGAVVRTEYVTSPNYVYSYDKNYADFKKFSYYGYSAARHFQVKLRVRHKDNTLGPEVAALVSNPQSTIDANKVTVEKTFNTITVRYERPLDSDFFGTAIWISNDVNVPKSGKATFAGPDSNIAFSNLVPNTTYYIRMVAYDSFGVGVNDNGIVLTAKTTVIDADSIGEGIIGKSKMLADLQAEIGLITDPDTVVGSVNARLASTMTAVDEKVAGLLKTPAYAANVTYREGAFVTYNSGLYQARQNTLGHLPTDDAYWRYIGQYSSVGDAIALQTENITTVANGLSSEVQARTDLAAVANAKNKTYRQNAAPTTGMTSGDIWYDSDDSNKPYRYSGTAWVATDDTRIATNAAAISTEATARADADSSLATTISTVSAVANAKNKTYRQAAAPTTGMIGGDLWFDSDDGNKAYRYSGTAWVATDDTRIAANAALITDEATARADADAALATTISTVSATANAKNKTYSQAAAPTLNLVTGDIWYDSDDNNKQYRYNGSSWVATDDARIAANVAAITNEATARANADAAMASTISTVSAVANAKNKTYSQGSAPLTGMVGGDIWYDSDDGNKAYRFNGDSWVATDDARIVANMSAITTESAARADGDNASASMITTLQSRIYNDDELSFEPSLKWDFATTNGWTFYSLTTAVANSILTTTSTAAGAYMVSPTTSFSGAEFDKVRIRLKRISGTGAWEGNLYYRTAGHGHTNSYRKTAYAPLDNDKFATVEFDMAALTAGGTDWSDNVITNIRFDVTAAAGDVWAIDWIAVGKRGVGVDTSRVASIEVAAATVADDVTGLSAQYTVKVDVNGYVSGFGLASTATDGVPTSEFIVNADKFAVVTPGQPGKHPFTIGQVNGVTKTVIDSALIADASIGSAHITDASVGTLAIAGNAVTVASSATGTTQASTTITVPTGAASQPVIISVSALNSQNGAAGYTNYAVRRFVRLFRNGTEIKLVRDMAETTQYQAHDLTTAFTVLDTPGAGTHTYLATIRNQSDSAAAGTGCSVVCYLGKR